MGLHRNARLGLAGRRALVADVEAGCSCREAARRRGVSPTTACKWWRRWSQATLEQRQIACLSRGSLVAAAPLAAAAAGRLSRQRICAARRRSGWGPRLIAGETGHRARDRLADAAGGRGSRGRRGSRASSRACTSGPAPATCCTSTASASSASPGPATPSPATATAPAPRSGCGSATSGCTRSSTTTPATPTASSTATSGRRP